MSILPVVVVLVVRAGEKRAAVGETMKINPQSAFKGLGKEKMLQKEESKREGRGQFHQHFTHIFYVHGSQKRKQDSQLKQLFALWGSARVKAAPKLVDEIDPRRGKKWNER